MLPGRTLTASVLALTAPLGLAAQQKAADHPAMARNTTFTIRVENLTRGEVLKLSDGKTAPFVIAPVLWVVHRGSTSPLFTGGKVDAGRGLRALAETGNPEPLSKSIAGDPGVVAVGAAARPAGAQENGPLAPGQAYEFTVTAAPGQFLSVAAMFGQSNDWFYANDRPIALFRGGKPVSGDMSPQIALYDAGTEVDEEPGLGPNQGPRQKDPEAGIREKEPVAHAGGRWRIPATSTVFRLTIAPQGAAMSSK
jgi:hypothetical protein